MSTQQHNAAILDLEPETIIELYELDLGEQMGYYRFHPGKNNLQDIILSDDKGVPQTYYPLPIEATNFELRGDGQLPRPKLMIANPQGVITDLIKRRGDLVGKEVKRKRIFLKFLDHVNFPSEFNPYGVPDPESRFDDDYFIVNRKVQENKYYIEFELVSPLELEDIQIPARQMIANYCPWQYRGDGCAYGRRSDFENQKVRMADGSEVSPAQFFGTDGNLGIPVADDKNKYFTSAEGYNLTLAWEGEYNASTSYSVGAVVRIKSKIQNPAKSGTANKQEEVISRPDSFFVCIKAASDKDPRFEQSYWRRDQCAKNLQGCAARYAKYGSDYKRGLPFGGFPSIERYRF